MKAEIAVANFIAFNQDAVLSTKSKRFSGYPFGSVVPYAILPDWTFVIYISRIAEHFKNLSNATEACLTVVQRIPTPDPQAEMRISMLLNFAPVSEQLRQQCLERYQHRFPGSVRHELAHDFVFFCGQPKHIRWIGGFGSMGWSSTDEFVAVPIDPIAYDGKDIADHLNADHRAALCDFALSKNITVEPQNVIVDLVTSESFWLRVFPSGERIEFRFSQRAVSIDDVRQQTIAMLREARQSKSR